MGKKVQWIPRTAGDSSKIHSRSDIVWGDEAYPFESRSGRGNEREIGLYMVSGTPNDRSLDVREVPKEISGRVERVVEKYQ